MLGLLNFRVYTFIAVIVAAIMLAIWNFDTGRAFVTYIQSVGNVAAASPLGGTISGFVTTPIVWSASDPLGAVVAGLLWPLALAWLIFFIALFVFSIFAPTFSAATNLP
jgi:uncharacterized membrane protein YjfL (UPF0719 family)